ncbi:MAG: ATP-dependent DNA ligase, partial [Thaumarchaeota archaeon]
ACALAFLGSKEGRPLIERAYNIHPDLGFIVETLASKGLKGIKAIRVEVGVPIRPMLAERLNSAKAIIAKLGNKVVAAEYKLDGERLQIHKRNEDVTLFSRRLEVITHNYPDVLELVAKNVASGEAILEAEVVAINEDTGEYLPFQELMHRRRKYGVAEAMKQYPVALNFFDLLSDDKKDHTNFPYSERRAKLETVVKETERTRPVPALRTADPEEIEKFMEDAIANGCEGLVVKDLEGVYRAGAREFSWVKIKREYRSELTDTIDLVIVGAFHGRGRRAGTYGTYLLAAYDDKKASFPTVSKIGTGFTDEDLQKFPRLLKKYESRVKPPNVESNLIPDVWFRPHRERTCPEVPKVHGKDKRRQEAGGCDDGRGDSRDVQPPAEEGREGGSVGRAKSPVSCVPQPGHDVALLVQLPVDGARVELRVRVDPSNVVDPLAGGDDREEDQPLRLSSRHDPVGHLYEGVARREHRVSYDHDVVLVNRRYLRVTDLYTKVGWLSPPSADYPCPRHREHLVHPLDEGNRGP